MIPQNVGLDPHGKIERAEPGIIETRLKSDRGRVTVVR
jgi:hypothetical protein